MTIWVAFISIIVLILINAFFAGSEVAIIAANKSLVEDRANKGNKTAKLVLDYMNNSTGLFSVIQVGITFVGFLNGFLAADSFTVPIARLINYAIPNIVITIIITIILTYLQVIFGEIIPKKIAMKSPESFIYKTIRPIHILKIIASPLVWVLTKSADGVAKMLNVYHVDEQLTEEELRILVMGSGNALKSEEKDLFERILDFDDQIASDIMTHRTEVEAIDISDSYEDILKLVKTAMYSRYPVYEESLDNILGVLHIKDLLTNPPNGNNFNIKNYLRKPYYIPESTIIDTLFKNMKKTKNHFAIVVDEFGGTSGIVTLEDVLEEIVGDIFDEHDEVTVEIKKIAENSYLIDGLTSIDDVESLLKANLPTEEYETLSGFMLGVIGRMPENDEEISFEYEGFLYEVIEYEDNYMSRIKVTKITLEEVE